MKIYGSGLQISPDQDGCVSCNSLLWGTQLAEIILNYTSYHLIFCFSPRGRPWKSHLQSLVLSVILSAWMCAVKSITCSAAIVFSAGDWICVTEFWTKSVLHLDGLCTHISHKSLKHYKPENCELEIFTMSK